MIGPVCTLVLAAAPLVSAFAFIFGNHNGFSWNLVAGVSVLTATFLLLLWIGVRRLRNPPRLGMDVSGVVVHRGRRATRLAWDDVADVRLTTIRGEGLTFIFPTIRGSDGKEYKVSGLVETPRHADRARRAVATILATRDRQLALAAALATDRTEET